ncbi:MAG TPA: tetratricopeptide repeat protein [Flavobacteriales bacterium]|nr:tetratricopeptide repeat protein [Flavobacteriales bacterium]
MVACAALVVVLLSLAPRTPQNAATDNAASARVSEDPNSGSTPHAEGAAPATMPTARDPKVAAILAELSNGAAPMQTILKLRDLAEKEPDNIDAQYHLGVFSWQTGQYDKAMARFRTVVAKDPTNYPDAFAYLGQAYASLDSTDKAIAALETYKTLVTDTAMRNGADRLITELKTKANTH